MTLRITETELSTLGYAIDPIDPATAIPISSDDLPNESWSVERLMTYGSTAVSESGRLFNQATCLARKSTVQIYRAGRALTIARKKLPADVNWTTALKKYNIPRTTAWEATKLFDLAPSEDAIASLSITEAKEKYGITREKATDEDVTKAGLSHPSTSADRVPLSGVDDDDTEPDGEAEPIGLDSELLNDPTDDDSFDANEVEHVVVEPANDLENDDFDEQVEAGPTPLEVITKMVVRLEYLEETIVESELESTPRQELVDTLDEAIEILRRIRRQIS